MAPDQLDEPDNLLLLCRIHHKVVDDQFTTYSVEKLRGIRHAHEAWISMTLSGKAGQQQVRVKRTQKGTPDNLVRLLSGRDLFAVLNGACGYDFDNDDLNTQHEVDLISAFCQECQDYGDISSDFEVGQQVTAAFRLGELIRELEEAGFWVFGAREIRVIEGGKNPPSPFPIAIVRVLRRDNPQIIKVDLSGAT